ncbi:MAG: DUF6452 family protein [Flavobacterium sp.]
MKKIILLVFAIALSFSGCEKDDICEGNTPTTPRLIIEFYDNLNPTVLKNVTNLKVTGEGATGVGTTFYLLFDAKSKIELPLKTTEDLTKYTLVLNATNSSTISTDELQFNYSRANVYVSRACGFKTIYDLNGTSLTPFILNNNPTLTQGNWIKNIEVIQPNINDENETHIKIYF